MKRDVVRKMGFKVVRENGTTEIDIPSLPLVMYVVFGFGSVLSAGMIWADSNVWLGYTFIGVLTTYAIYKLARRGRIFIDDQTFQYVSKLGPYSSGFTCSLDDVGNVWVETGQHGHVSIEVQSTLTNHHIGVGLSESQREWLAHTIELELEDRLDPPR